MTCYLMDPSKVTFGRVGRLSKFNIASHVRIPLLVLTDLSSSRLIVSLQSSEDNR